MRIESGLRRLGQSIVDWGSTARSVGYIRDTDSQRQLLTDRVQTMVAEVAARLRPASKLPKMEAAQLFNSNQNALIEAARAHGELLQWEAFTDAVEKIEHEGTRQVLTWLRDLFGLGLIEKHAAWYLIRGRISAQRAQAITSYIDDRLLPRLRELGPAAITLAEAEVPKAMADAFRQGHLGIMDYYRMRNVQADTAMRSSIAGDSSTKQSSDQ